MALLYEKEDKIVVVTLNRPEAMNAFDPETCTEFHNAMVRYRDDDEAWVCIITGAGDRAFSAGADLKKLIPAVADGSFKHPPTPMRGMEIWKPLIAAVNGLALGGGCELVLACDLRIAAEKATFGQPEIRWSLLPGWGGTQRWPRAVPWALAAEVLLTGQSITAQEAYRIGLINKVVPPAELMSTAKEYAAKICQNGPLGVWASKEAMLKGTSMSLEEGLQLEQSLSRKLSATEDAHEGPRAFAEKRKPVFKLR